MSESGFGACGIRYGVALDGVTPVCGLAKGHTGAHVDAAHSAPATVEWAPRTALTPTEAEIRAAYESGRTATVRTAVIAGKPWAVSTVRVITVDGSRLYCTTDGIWFTIVDSDSPYSSWSIDPEPPNTDVSTVGLAASAPFNAGDNSTYGDRHTDAEGEFGATVYPLRRVQAAHSRRDDNGMMLWRVIRVSEFTPDASWEAHVCRGGSAMNAAPAFGQDPARGILAVNPYAEGSHEWHAWGLGFSIPRMRAWAHLDVAEIMGFAPWDFTLAERDEIFAAWDNGRDAYAKGWR